MIEVLKHLSYNQTFVSWGIVAIALGLQTCIKACNQKTSSSLRRLDQSSPDFKWGFLLKKEVINCSNGSASLNKIYGKALKTSSSSEPGKL